MTFNQLSVSTQLIVLKDFISWKMSDNIELSILEAINLLSIDTTTLYYSNGEIILE